MISSGEALPYGDTLDMGVWMCLPYAVADCLGDFMGVMCWLPELRGEGRVIAVETPAASDLGHLPSMMVVFG